MKRLWIGILGLALVAGLAAMALTSRARRPAWSTESEAALAAFERGLTADIKYYGGEAREAFEREYLSRHLALSGYNMATLARRVGQERTHLYRKLKSLGLQTKKNS